MKHFKSHKGQQIVVPGRGVKLREDQWEGDVFDDAGL